MKNTEESPWLMIIFFSTDYSFYGAPFSEQTLENMKRKRLQELRMKRIFAELLLYVCFLVVLYFISYNNRDFNSFQMRRHLSSHLLHSPTKNSSFHTLRYDKVIYYCEIDSFPLELISDQFLKRTIFVVA